MGNEDKRKKEKKKRKKKKVSIVWTMWWKARSPWENETNKR
jgi:hypothetical protein